MNPMTAKKGSNRSNPKLPPPPPPRVPPQTGPARKIGEALRRPLVPGRHIIKMPHEK